MGRAVPMMLAALSSYHAGVSQLVIAGDVNDRQMVAMMQAAGRQYLPFTVTVPIVPEHRGALQRVLPWTFAFGETTAATAYVCRNFSCEVPATSLEELRARLDTLRRM